MLSISTVFMLFLVLFVLMCKTKCFKESAVGIWLRWKVLNPMAQILVIIFIGYMTIFAAVKPPVVPTAPPMGLEGTPNVLEVLLSISRKAPEATKDIPEMFSNPFDRNSDEGSFVSRIVTNTALAWLNDTNNSIVYSGWTNYGIAEDTFWVCKTNPAASWDFIYADTLVDGAHVSSSGTLSFDVPKGSPTPHEMPDGTGIDFLAPFHTTLAMIPPNGRFWYLVTDSNSVRFTWQNFLVGRDTNNAISFQAELFNNGDYTFRYALPPHFLSFTNNFVIGAQFGGVGETYAMNNYSNLADGVDIIWDLPDSQVDTDGDGTYDIVELYYGFDPKAYTPPDWDNDGLLNNFEYYYTNSVPTNGLERLNARLFDSDGDKLPDLFEVMYTNFNPLVAHSTTNECLTGDPDGDNLNNAMEMFYGTDPNQSGWAVYNDRCEVMVALTSEDSSDYMMRTVTDEGNTNIILSAYNYNWETISYELNKVIDFKYSRNVESTEYYENFSTFECTFDIQDYWKGFCYITNAVNPENFYDPQTMVLDVQQTLIKSAMEMNSGGQNVNTNGVYIFETVLSVDNLTCSDTDLDYVSPCGTYPSVTPSAILSIEADPNVSLPNGATTPMVQQNDKDYTSYFEFSDTYAQTNDSYIVFYADHNGDAELPISNHFDFAAIELNDETSGASATVTIKEDGSTVFEGFLNMPSLDITYHTRAIDIMLPAVLNMKGNPIGEDYFSVDLQGTHCFIYDEYVDLTFADNSSLYLSPEVSLPYTFNTKGMSTGDTQLYYGIEAGSTCSTSLGDVGITASFALPEEGTEFATDYTTVIALDLDVDSDNDNGYNTPDMDADEEEIQETSSIGKIIRRYRADVDGDGVPNIEDMDHGGLFVPLVVMSHPSATTAKYKFTFNNDIRIWTKDGNSTERTNEFIRLEGDRLESGYEYEYSDLFTGALLSYGSLRGKVLYVEGLTNGTQNISCSYILEDSTLYTETVKVSVIDVALVPNYDRDGDIGTDDIARYSTNEVYRFWINDDDDDPDKEDGDDKDDVPGDGTADWEDEALIGTTYKIDGTRDLIDFFPVAILGLEDTLIILPASEYEYTLWQASESLNIYKTPELDPDEVDKYLYDKDYCLARNRAEVYHVEGDDILLNDFMSNLTDENECVVLFEGREESTSPLVLEIRRKSDDQIVYSTLMRLSISDIEDMYRYLNFRDGGTHITGERQKYPDSLCNEKNVFFIHGVNIEENLARGWNAEVFKRLHWAGSNAKFWGVTWHSDGVNLDDDAYHPNVHTAFETAADLANTLSSVSNKVILAHSLGNILTCSAIEDHNLQVDKYFMLNAAVAAETFKASLASTSIVNNYMVHEDWTNYVSRTWCSEWYNFFDLPDKRATLTWRGRFANVVSNAYNYYSSEDEVFEIFEGMPAFWTGMWDTVLGRRYCWQKQELFKGRKSLLNPLGSTSWAGWGFEKTLGVVKYSPQEASNLTTNELRTAPVFNNVLYEAFGPSLYSDSLFSTNLVKTQIDELLAKAIPALSYAIGKTNVALSVKPDFNFDIATEIERPNGWISRGDPMGNRWLHEDLIDMAYLYNYKLYEQLVQEGDLDD